MPRLTRPGVNPPEREFLCFTYDRGGLTPGEANERAKRLSVNLADLFSRGLLHTTYTLMGELIVLTVPGFQVIAGGKRVHRSLTRSIDLAYERLCLDDLGWTVLREAVRSGPELSSGLSRYPRVQTDQRDAYVVAKLSRGGISTGAIHRLAKRYRSTLAATNHDLVIITPSPRRGLQAAQGYSANVRFEHLLPQTQPGVKGRRVWTGEDVGDLWESPPIQGAAITELQASELRHQGVPDLTLEILQLTRKERIERAHEALACDGVITEGQLRRHFKLEAEDFPRVLYVEDLAHPVHMRRSLEVRVRFYLASRKLGHSEVPQLAHRAGTGELRHLYGVRPEQCEQVRQNTKNLRRHFEEPDAIWHPDPADRTRRVAVEFDTGSYPRKVIEEKREAFRKHFEGIVWGVTSQRRQASVASLLTQRVDLVQWWH